MKEIRMTIIIHDDDHPDAFFDYCLSDDGEYVSHNDGWYLMAGDDDWWESDDEYEYSNPFKAIAERAIAIHGERDE